MICMVPATPYLRARPQLADERARLVEDATTTTHWPGEVAVVSRGPPGSGVGGSGWLSKSEKGQGMRALPPEARALVVGERCAVRAARCGVGVGVS